MTTPRTVAGQAAMSGMRPHVKRALAQTIVAIEDEAIAPYLRALREADGVLAALAAMDDGAPSDVGSMADLHERAAAARRMAEPLLAQHGAPIQP
jgi:hypothetical protein